MKINKYNISSLSSIGEIIAREKREMTVLLRNIPSTVVSMFVVSVVCMNLLANKTILQNEWIALDGGFLISWMSFLCMDIITKHFGAKASNMVAFMATAVNLLACAVFYMASIIPSSAGDYTAFNDIFGGTWFILLGSTVAFLISAVINNLLNMAVGRLFRKNPDGKIAYMTRTCVSTFVGQFVDNLLFAVIVFVIFAPVFWDGFHWTVIQCVSCALTGAAAELVMEVIFAPFGYRILKMWQEENVGKEYLSYIKENE